MSEQSHEHFRETEVFKLYSVELTLFLLLCRCIMKINVHIFLEL